MLPMAQSLVTSFWSMWFTSSILKMQTGARADCKKSGAPKQPTTTSKRKRANDSASVLEALGAEVVLSNMDWLKSLALQGVDAPKLRAQLQESEKQRQEADMRCQKVELRLKDLQSDFRRKKQGIYDMGSEINALKNQVELLQQKRANEREELHSHFQLHDSMETSSSRNGASGKSVVVIKSDRRVQRLVDRLNRTIQLPQDSSDFPSALEPAHIRCKWGDCLEELSAIAEEELLSPQEINPSRLAGQFNPSVVSLFGNTRTVPYHESGAAVRSLDSEILPQVLQAYMMHLLCDRIFLAKEWYETCFGEGAIGMVAATRELLALTSEGAEGLRRLDAMAFKLVLENGGEHFDRYVLPQEASNIASGINEALEPFFVNSDEYYPHPRDKSLAALKTCAESLMRLKFELLLTPKEYEIKWFTSWSSV
ncbi:hypothetical protein CC86DRAFT_162636 [Ophiobolus disseminans]|uniref:Uncharacterized protein n=1 Tax=Ophiobolus disseminans TaxID=1469910 RepID=A0A6A7AB46_9PLEO|nr:hypothetical protein CC86DRAFT_162636 [Ophiobolus disseminans]